MGLCDRATTSGMRSQANFALSLLCSTCCQMNARLVKPEHGAISLPDKAALVIGPVYVYFTLPVAPFSGGEGAPKTASGAASSAGGEGASKTAVASGAVSSAGSAGAGGGGAGGGVNGGSGRGGKTSQYALLISEAFAAADAEAGGMLGSAGALTKKQICDRIMATHGDLAEPSKRALLLKSAGFYLNSKADRDSADANRFTLPADFLVRAGGGGGSETKSPRPTGKKRKASADGNGEASGGLDAALDGESSRDLS